MATPKFQVVIDVTYAACSGPVTAAEIQQAMMDTVDSASFPGIIATMTIHTTERIAPHPASGPN